jgi:predicted AAA+ superfamily ATPase
MAFDDLDIDWDYLLERLERLIDLGEARLSRSFDEENIDSELFAGAAAFYWQGDGLRPLLDVDLLPLDRLVGMERQCATIEKNTAHFVSAVPAHHVLIRGGRGLGKTALVRGLLPRFVPQGLRVIEIRTGQLHHLEALVRWLQEIPLYFVVLCEDIEPAANPEGYQSLLAVLNRGLIGCPDNVRLYATMTDEAADALTHGRGEDYFGLWLDVPQLDESAYLQVVANLVASYGCGVLDAAVQQAALRWAEQRHGFSGLTAEQFAVHYCAERSMLLAQQQEESPAD